MRTSKYRHIRRGDIYKTLPVLEVWSTNSGHYMGKFICICNNYFIRAFSNIDLKNDPVCGNCNRYRVAKAKEKFVIKDRRLYLIWKGMNSRCKDTANSKYEHYGGRGISVCEEWDDISIEGFNNFYRDVGIYPTPKHSIDRIDVNKGYYKQNVRWATSKQQMNNIRVNHVVEWKGCSYTITELAEQIGIIPNTLLYRVRRGWSIEDAVSGKRCKDWKRPLRKLSDEMFNEILIRFFYKRDKCYTLAKEYNIDCGNLHRVLHDPLVEVYYTTFLKDLNND